MPTREDFADLLAWFFVGPVEEATVARLEHDFSQLLLDRESEIATSSQFSANCVRYGGEAWKEVVSFHRLPPSRAEIAVWLARTKPGYPPPRPYCPDEFVGRWRQATPSAATWDLDGEGNVSTDDPYYGGVNTWCVHRGHRGKYEDTRFVAKGTRLSPHYMVVVEISSLIWRGRYSWLDGPVHYVLEKIE